MSAPQEVSGRRDRSATCPSPQCEAGQKFDAVSGLALYLASLAPDRTAPLGRYQMQDIAFKAVGVGAVGTFCCVALFMSGDSEPLFLQLKEAQHSVLERLGPKLAYKGRREDVSSRGNG